jgi:hypothetical protein
MNLKNTSECLLPVAKLKITSKRDKSNIGDIVSSNNS